MIDIPPWKIPSDEDRILGAKEIGAVGREKGPIFFTDWLNKNVSPLDLMVYSDGSKGPIGQVGGGYCLYRGHSSLPVYGKIPLGVTSEVYDAEVLAAVAGLRAAIQHPFANFARHIIVILDNEEAALRLHSLLPTDSSAAAFQEFQDLRDSWIRAPHSIDRSR